MKKSLAVRALWSIIIGTVLFAAFAWMSYLHGTNAKDNTQHHYETSHSYTQSNVVSNGGDNNKGGSNTDAGTSVSADDGYVRYIIDGTYKVVDVVDGDTIKVLYNGSEKKVRLIGIDTPETVDSRTNVQCYGPEATNYLRNKLNGKEVQLASDSSQDNTDQYGRLLRYAELNGLDVGVDLISGGYAKEYTYENSYFYQSAYKSAEESAKKNRLGVWSDKCNAQASSSDKSDSVATKKQPSTNQQDCVIKGNISYYGGKKIYHVPGQKYYDSTEINESAGERWFCSEAEAQAAGWRKSKE